ncbi:MAG TPA: PilT/PilU family type 4a pilus ATPase [Armatimonadota bacterium]|nr:PilT/PilU family type 4a pilus ATPase [Armatimonadota bacterium]
MTELSVEELFSEIRDDEAPRKTEEELQELLAKDPKAFFDAICLKAVQDKAADIFWKAGAPPAFRLSSNIVPLDIEPLTPAQLEEIFLNNVLSEDQRQKFKVRPEMDTALEIPGVIRFRVNVYKQRNAIASVMRLIPLDIPTLDELGLPKVLSTLVTHKQGMILVTGPTGSGKSTTLAAMLDLINTNRRCNIISIEDPIEFVHRDKLSVMSQREVGVDTANFGDALRAVLRQAPDVILVGEMRDVETMSVAMTAAETGHLVFSTVHTNSASETIERIVNMYPPHEKLQICLRLSSTLLGVLSQKLPPTVDGKGRVCAIEVMINTPTIQKHIEEGHAGEILPAINEGGYWGMQSMNKSLLDHFVSGRIDEKTAVAYSGNATEMRQSIRRLAQAKLTVQASTA